MTNTRVILLVIVHSVIHAALAEYAVIEFNVYTKYFDDYRCDSVNRPIIIEDKPTSIRVHVNSSMDITDGNCYYQDKNIQLSKTEYSRNIFLIQKQLEFKLADKKITCNFHTSSQMVLINCDTLLHIRTNTPVAQIYLNYNEVATTRTPVDVREYDASILYYFIHGETVVIDCKHSQQSGYSKIMYYNNTGGKLLETGYLSPHVSVHIKLTQESHSNYVDCYYKNFITSRNNEKGDVTVTRILFKLQSAEIEQKNNIITLHINGMYVRPTGEVYEYVYYAGDTADISCESRRDDHLIYLDYGGPNEEWLVKANKTLYLDKNNDIKVVSCTAKDKHTPEVKATVSVKLIESVSELYITGLNKANILQQYPETEDSSVINYQFLDNEMLTLNCSVSKNYANKLGWTFNESSVASAEEKRSVVRSIYLERVLQASYDNLTIKCILEPNVNSRQTHQIVIRLAYKTKSDIVDEEFASQYWTWISSGIVMIVIIMIIIIYKVRNYKKRRNEIQSSNMNLVNSSESPLPHPRQWDETNYTELKVSDIYNGLDYENITINKGLTSKNYSENNYATVNNNRSRNIIMELNHEYTYILPVNNTNNLEKTNAVNNSRIRFTGTRTGGNNYEDTGIIQGPSHVNNHVSEEPEHIYCEVR